MRRIRPVLAPKKKRTRKNPSLVGAKMSFTVRATQGTVYEVRYKRNHDGLDYKHAFTHEPDLVLIESPDFGKGLLITNWRDDLPTWGKD